MYYTWVEWEMHTQYFELEEKGKTTWKALPKSNIIVLNGREV